MRSHNGGGWCVCVCARLYAWHNTSSTAHSRTSLPYARALCLGRARLQREGQLGTRIVFAQDHLLLLLDALRMLFAHLLAFLVHLALLFDNGEPFLGLYGAIEMERYYCTRVSNAISLMGPTLTSFFWASSILRLFSAKMTSSSSRFFSSSSYKRSSS